MKPLYLIGLFLSASSVWAGESVMLTTGFTLHADRHELSGGKVLIYEGGGVTEMPASMIAGIEADESPGARPGTCCYSAGCPAGAAG